MGSGSSKAGQVLLKHAHWVSTVQLIGSPAMKAGYGACGFLCSRAYAPCLQAIRLQACNVQCMVETGADLLVAVTLHW